MFSSESLLDIHPLYLIPGVINVTPPIQDLFLILEGKYCSQGTRDNRAVAILIGGIGYYLY